MHTMQLGCRGMLIGVFRVVELLRPRGPVAGDGGKATHPSGVSRMKRSEPPDPGSYLQPPNSGKDLKHCRG
jgi:hypothetical protein